MKKIKIYLIVIGAFLILFFFIDIYIVDGESMNSTIKNNALVVVLKYNLISNYFFKITRNDDVVFKFLDNGSDKKMILKNVFGSIGDTCIIDSFLDKYKLFTIKNKQIKKYIFLNEESKIFFFNRNKYWFVSKKREEIPLNKHYFVVGTNKKTSFDSRDFGPIPVESITGKVIFYFNY